MKNEDGCHLVIACRLTAGGARAPDTNKQYNRLCGCGENTLFKNSPAGSSHSQHEEDEEGTHPVIEEAAGYQPWALSPAQVIVPSKISTGPLTHGVCPFNCGARSSEMDLTTISKITFPKQKLQGIMFTLLHAFFSFPAPEFTKHRLKHPGERLQRTT